MSLSIGDHLVIKRNGVIVPPDTENYHEFEVIASPEHFDAPDSKYWAKAGYNVKLEVVE